MIKLRCFSKLVDKSAPSYLCELVPPPPPRPLRNQNDIRNMKCRTETFQSSFIPSSINHWNHLESANRNSNYFKNLMKSHTSCDLYNFGDRETSVKHAQLRMKCSRLNGHLFDLHVIESASCTCGFNIEDTNHFLFNCLLFNDERNVLIDMLHNLNILDITEDLLLRGSAEYSLELNQKVFSCTFSFIKSTNRP